jgi:YVTN family beta-propeller protein
MASRLRMENGSVQPFLQLCAALALTAMAACGGNGSGSATPPPPPPPSPSFTLGFNPTSVALAPGNSINVSVSATPLNGFSSQVGVQISGLPTGVSASPPSLSLAVGTPQVVTLSALSTTPVFSGSLTFTGTSGSVVIPANLPLSISAVLPSSNTPPSRTRYLRTDATTEYALELDTHWIIYNPNTSQFYVSDPQSNHVLVIDAATEKQVATISVPGAYGMDDTPDHKTLYVGTQVGDVYAIDTASNTVTKRYIASQIGPNGFQALSALVLSNGSVALLGAAGGIPVVDGSPTFAVWSPTSNSITIYGTSYGGSQLPPGVPFTTICGPTDANLFGFARTVDRTKILVSSLNLCEVDPSTGQTSYSAPGASPAPIVTSPDGKYIALANYPNQIVLLDPNTLHQIAAFDVSDQALSTSAWLFSADSATLFIATDTIVYAYNVSTQQQIGWTPNIFLPPISGGLAGGPINSPNIQAVDGTGLLAGPMEEGVGFIDSSAMNTGPIGSLFTNAYLTPPAGPVAGGTQVQWSGPTTALNKNKIFFGGLTATFDSFTGDLLTATTPEGAPGPADVYVYATDGGIQIVPEGFSYGPTILEVTPNAATTEGGGSGIVYGYGFGPVLSSATPPDLEITVGGKRAAITFFNPNAYGLSSPPFLLQAVTYTIPAGAVGAADVTVSNSVGTATQTGAMSYLPATQQFPLAGAQLVQGVYDSYNDQYYFTDTNQVRVFSLSQGQWLPPIPIPAPAGTTQRFWGIALSPDGSKLAISDAMAGVIYTLDPVNPSSVKTYSIGASGPAAPYTFPCGVAISDAGNVYFAVFDLAGTGDQGFFKLNTGTGAVTSYGFANPGSGMSDANLRTVISSDNSRVYFNDDGYVFSIETATDKIVSASDYPGCCYGDYDLTLASGQQRFEATSFLYDRDLDAESFYALNDREVLNISYVYGAKLAPDGGLLFQPSANGIDVLDGRLGNLLTRISLPFALSTNYDALVDDGKDNTLIAITGATGDGIAVLNLTSISEPAPLPYGKSKPALASLVSQQLPPDPASSATTAGRRSAATSHSVKHVTRANFPRQR